MAVGKLASKVFLDRPWQTYYGTETNVTGVVTITFLPKRQAELVGLLVVNVTLEGRAKIKMCPTSGATDYDGNVRSSVPLLAITATIHSGITTITADKQLVLRFSIPFPKSIDSHSDRQLDATLPPSMRCECWHEVSIKPFECFVEYRIQEEVLAPGLDVTVLSTEAGRGLLLRYDRPRVPAAMVHDASIERLSRTLCISNEYLLPINERPTGLIAKTKAFFKPDFPTFLTDIAINGPAILIRGEAISFTLQLRPNLQSTVKDFPALYLDEFGMTLTIITTVKLDKGQTSCFEDKRLKMVGVAVVRKPFERANSYTKTFVFRPTDELPSSFESSIIERSYSVDFDIKLFAAETERIVSFRGTPVKILSAALGRAEGVSVPEVKLAAQIEPPAFKEQPPAYEP